MFPGRDDETKKQLALKMQAALVEALGVDKSVVSVSIEDVEKEKWGENIARFKKDAMFVPPGY